MILSQRRVRFLLISLFIFFSIACTLETPGPAQEEAGITVLAGSELRDLEPLLPEIWRATGVRMTFQYTGTLEGAEQIAAGESAGKPVDFAWFSHAKYISLLKSASVRVLAQEKIMLSPVVLGVKMSKATAWGWVDNANLTWGDIAAKAGSGELHFAMTNPASSNSGFSALVGVTSSLAGEADALNSSDIRAESEALKTFFKGQALVARGSGWLADPYVADQDRLDGMINYESVLLSLNKSGQLRDPLYLVYPKEGTITADYPLLLINPNRRAAYQKVVAFLLSPAFQQKVMVKTLRRPVDTQVKLSSDFSTQLRVELPFPGSLEVANQLLSACPDQQTRPVHIYFVVDTGQPAKGSQLDNLKKTLYSLTGADISPASRFARFPNQEKVTIITFNNRVSARQDFDVDLNQPSSLRPIQAYVDGLRAGGSSALYSALAEAYQQAARDKAAEPDRAYSIVLMSYGQSNTGISENRFLASYRRLADARDMRMFALFFGDEEMKTMQSIANETGGRLLTAGQDSFLVIFNEIRGYE